MKRYDQNHRMEHLGWEPENKPRHTGFYRSVQIGLFFGVLFLLAVISWILPLHPKTSEAEKRDLAQYPAFSLAALASGD